MTLPICNSYLEVDSAILVENARRVQAHVAASGRAWLPVLKGNSYGFGIVEVGKLLYERCGVQQMICAQTVEAYTLRKAGVLADFLILGGTPYHNIACVVEQDFMTTVFQPEYLTLLDAEAARQGRRARVQIKLETGLNRVGVKLGCDLDALLTHIKTLPNIDMVGVYAHFTESEEENWTLQRAQYDLFLQGLAQIRAAGFDPAMRHMCNSAATVWFPTPECTHVRTGGLHLGYDTNLSKKNPLGVQEPLTWRTFVTHVKDVEAGDTVGYSRSYKVKKTTRVATLSFGYGDGYYRKLAFQGADVLIHGQRAPIIGICMDQTMADVTHIEGVTWNDPVTLLGRDGDAEISIFELAKLMGQTYIEAIVKITGRVPRLYI